MNRISAVVVVLIAIVLAIGAYVYSRAPEVAAPEIAAPEQAPQEGMSGMAGMAGNATPDCIRYDLIDGAWVCTATAAATGSGN